MPDRVSGAFKGDISLKTQTSPMIKLTQNGLLQTLPGFEKKWTLAELLETCDPLAGEPLAARNEAMQKILPVAEELYGELSEAARLRYDFWKQLRPRRIEERKFEYTVKISGTYRWELTLNHEGLFYKDLTPLYGQQPGQVHEQLFSDFWFCGPLMPIPGLATRKWLVAHIRDAFLQSGSPAGYAHFKLFEYPHFVNMPQWEDGDYRAMGYVYLRPYGIEHGRSNWHDGLVYCGFISFERLLADPKGLERTISPEIQAEILEFLPIKTPTAANAEIEIEPNAESKRLFMENGGNLHYIGRDGFMDVYRATPAEEAAWRQELIEKYTRRLGVEDNETVLTGIAETLEYNGVKNLADLLCEAAKTATLKARQSIAQVLVQKFDPEKGAEVMLSLLDLEDEGSYWRNYVFNAFFRMRNSRLGFSCAVASAIDHPSKCVECGP